jgi:hypothetical protein
MKKLLSIALLMALISPQAFATKARLIALGMDELDNEGSYYIEDSRNIFLNAANVNDYADTVIFEWGEDGLFPGTNNTFASYDTDGKPKAQGGFLKSYGDMVYGLYLGNESNTSSLLKILSTAPSTAATGKFLDSSDNQIDVFLGKNMSGIDWGLNFVYTSSEFESIDSEDSGYAVRLGAKSEGWNAFLNASVGGESKKTVAQADAVGTTTADVTQSFDGNIGIHVGGGYDINDDGRIYAYFKRFGWDQFDSEGEVTALGDRGQEGTVEGSFDTYSVGYGHTVEHEDGTLFTDIHVRKRNIEVDFNEKAEVDELIVPITIGYEAAATSWLTLRGSVKYNLYGVTKNNNFDQLNPVIDPLAENIFGKDTDGKKATIRDSTIVNTGASLTFGDLVVDGLIGTTLSGNSRVGSDSLTLDEVMARVGATYSF